MDNSEIKKLKYQYKIAREKRKLRKLDLKYILASAGVPEQRAPASASSPCRNASNGSHGAVGVDALFVESMQNFLTEHYMLFAGRAGGDIKIKIVPKNANVMELTQPCILEWDRVASIFGIEGPRPAQLPVVFDLKSVMNRTTVVPNHATAMEAALQAQITSKIASGAVDAIDTHLCTDTSSPSYKLSRSSEKLTADMAPHLDGGDDGDDIGIPEEFADQAQNVITLSSRPDCTGTSVPFCLEVKSPADWLKLYPQLLERCAALLATCYLLRLCVAFGYCAGKAFVCIGERDIEAKESTPYQIKMTVFSLEDAGSLDLYWDALSKLPITRFLSRDAIPMCRALNALDINPFLCRTDLMGRSNLHRVYGVYFPMKGPRGVPTFVTKPHPDPWKVIKVVDGDANYGSEKAALEAIQPAWYSGHFSMSAHRLPLKPGRGVATNAMKCSQLEPSASSKLPWWNQIPNDEFSGGVIFMEPGKQICSELLPEKDIDWDQVLRECSDSLERMHECGYCHCDARVPNICKFGDKYDMIDFGFARKLSDSGSVRVRVDQPDRTDLPAPMVRAIEKVRHSNRTGPISSGGFRFFVDELVQIWIEWDVALDFQMLEHNVESQRRKNSRDSSI